MSGQALLHARQILRAAGVAPGMHIADFGVGRNGHLVFPAAEMVGEHGRVYGIDIVPDVLRMLEGRRRQFLVHNLDLVHADFERGIVPLADDSLDRIFIVHTLGIAREHDAVAQEVSRLLKPEGEVIIIDWHPEAKHPVAPQQEFRVHPQALEKVFVRNGCHACGDFLPSPWHWGRMYRKYV